MLRCPPQPLGKDKSKKVQQCCLSTAWVPEYYQATAFRILQRVSNWEAFKAISGPTFSAQRIKSHLGFMHIGRQSVESLKLLLHPPQHATFFRGELVGRLRHLG